jgi:hypothetical protein
MASVCHQRQLLNSPCLLSSIKQVLHLCKLCHIAGFYNCSLLAAPVGGAWFWGLELTAELLHVIACTLWSKHCLFALSPPTLLHNTLLAPIKGLGPGLQLPSIPGQ